MAGGGCGCVLTAARNIAGAECDAGKGFYLYRQLPRRNDYADTDDYNAMRHDQVAKFKLNYRLGAEDDPDTADDFFVLSWTMTLKTTDAITSLVERATIANSSLLRYAYHEFTPFSYPNVLYIDLSASPTSSTKASHRPTT